MREEEAELMAVAMAWDQAMLDNRAEAIGRYMTADWTLIGPDGRVNRREDFLQAIASGALSHDVVQAHDMELRFYGDAAVVINKGISGGQLQGEPFLVRERVSCLFVRQDGQWLCANTHLSPLDES